MSRKRPPADYFVPDKPIGQQIQERQARARAFSKRELLEILKEVESRVYEDGNHYAALDRAIEIVKTL